MLHEPERHEPLESLAWSEAAARAAIERIARDATERFDPVLLWPVHPLDRPPPAPPSLNLYMGAVGVIWALDALRHGGAAIEPRDFSDVVAAQLEPLRERLRSLTPTTGSLLMADAGVLLTRWKLAPSAGVADELAKAIAGNERHPALELMWGAPGTMLAALAMHEWTHEARWAELYRSSAAALLSSLEPAPENGCELWTQDLYGSRSKMLGAVHGFAGNAVALVRGRELLAADEWRALAPRIAATVSATALREGAFANWPQSVGPARPGRTALLVQHCHGAPGVVSCLAELPDPALDALLVAAGELTWAAGPVRKGSNLCHGTAGNGYAFLKLFRRTSDELWLERARAFGMHAIAQGERDLREYGQRRYSLWTGDLGLALYLQSCLEGSSRFPTVDFF